MYSQGDEERVILEYFTNLPPGRLLDLGAADGSAFSNSLALIERWWSADLVEGCARLYDSLRKRHGNNSIVSLYNIVVDVESRQTPFWDSGDLVNSLDQKIVLDYGFSPSSQIVTTVCLREWMRRHGPWDFITMDIDGINYELMRSVDATVWGSVPLICVEHEGRSSDIEAYLGETHRRLHQTAENLILARK